MFHRAQSKAGSRTRGLQEPCSVIGEGTLWQGDVRAGTGGLRVEGTVEGTILSEGWVEVALGGQVRGTVQVGSLTVGGRVEGVVRVAGCLHLQRTGWVEGDMSLGTLVVDEGGTLQGTCLRSLGEAAPDAPEPLRPRWDERSGGRPHGPAEAAEPLVPVRNLDRTRY